MLKLSEPMVRELHRIKKESTGRGRRGARAYGHRSTHDALTRRGLVARSRTRYGRGVRFVTWLTPLGKAVANLLRVSGRFAALALAVVFMGCTQLNITPDLTGTKVAQVEASTFGSGAMVVELDDDGDMTVDMGSDGTNVLGIFKGLFDAAARFLGGGGEAPTINVNVSEGNSDTNPTEAALTPNE